MNVRTRTLYTNTRPTPGAPVTGIALLDRVGSKEYQRITGRGLNSVESLHLIERARAQGKLRVSKLQDVDFHEPTEVEAMVILAVMRKAREGVCVQRSVDGVRIKL